MANTVIKRDGSKQPFDQEKLKGSIESACQDVGLDAERTAEVVNQVLPVALDAAAAQDEIATTEVRDIVLGELDKAEPSAAEAWRAHDQEKGKA